MADSAADDPSRPVDVDAWCPAWFRRGVRRFAADWQPDAVVAEYVFMSACLDDARRVAPRALAVIDTHDVMHRRRAVYAAAGLAPRWFHTTREEERRALERADLILAVQEEEAGALRELVPGRTVLVVPHAPDGRPAPLAAARPGRVLLAASYNDLNVAGLRWLLEQGAWSAVRSAVPEAELVVCGTIAEKVREVPAGVTIRGVVPSLDTEYAAARVVVNPVSTSTGVPVKTIEALVHGRPVVATPAGTARLDEEAGVVAAATPPAFAAALTRLLRDDASWTGLARAAAAYATAHFSAEAVFDPLVERLRDAARGRRRA